MKKIKELYQKFRVYITYLISSGIAFVLDLAIFSILLFFLESRVSSAIIICSFLARAISSLINYLINKYKVFNYDKKEKSTFYQYFTLVVINITLSSVLVSFLSSILSIYPTIIKAVIDGLIFVMNFFIQKIFIFNQDKKESTILPKIVLPILAFISIFIRLTINGLSFEYGTYDYICMFIYIILLFFLYFKVFKKDNHKSINLLSIIFTILMILGYSYVEVGTPWLVYNNELHILVTLIKFIGFYQLFKNIMNTAYNYLTTHKFKESKNKLCNLFNKHPFLFSFITLAILYSIYVIAYYPGVINYDNANQIKEMLGLHTRYLDSIVVLNPNITLTNFNPVLHTLILGGLFKIGVAIGNVNLGLFFFTIIQVLVFITVLSYSIYFLYKEKVKTNYLLFMLLIYIVVPFFPYYAITAVKDSLFSMFVILYIIKLYEFMKYDFKFKDYLGFFFIVLLVILFRNNGIYLVLLSFPFTLIWKKKIRKQILIFTLCIFVSYTGYNKILGALDIPNTSIREMLSIPFQQTARYVKYYDEDVTEEEKKVIDKILTYDTLGNRYVPELSDKVKNQYNKYTTNEELADYFSTWAKMFLKKPMTYINATVNNIDGYFYPNLYNWYVYTGLNHKLQEAGYDYHFNNLSILRDALNAYEAGYRFVPVIQLSVNCAFYTWAYLFLLVVLMLNKKKEYMVLLFPAFALLLTNIAGPANTYFRYVTPYAMSLPLIIGMILIIVNKKIKR